MRLSDIVTQPEGFTPPDIAVQINKVYERKSGSNDRGDWSFQNVMISDNGTNATLKLKNLPEFPVVREGQTVILRAHHSKQHGLTGLKVEYYQEKPQIIVTQSAKWEWGQSGAPVSGPGTGGSVEGTGHAPQPLKYTSDGRTETQAYVDHLLSCAALANQITTVLGIQDQAAIQASFATICIDTKNRGMILPKTLPSAITDEQKEQEAISQERSDSPEDDPDYPF